MSYVGPCDSWFCCMLRDTDRRPCQGSIPGAGHSFRYGSSHPRPTQPSIPPGLVNENQLRLGRQRQVLPQSVSGWTRGLEVKLWDPLRTSAIPERLRNVFTTRRYTNPRLPLPSNRVRLFQFVIAYCCTELDVLRLAFNRCCGKSTTRTSSSSTRSVSI